MSRSNPLGSVKEDTPLVAQGAPSYGDDDADSDFGGEEVFIGLKDDSVRRESHLADKLSMRLLAVADDDSVTEAEILNETLNIAVASSRSRSGSLRGDDTIQRAKRIIYKRLWVMLVLALLGLGVLFGSMYFGAQFLGPPNQPVGPYALVERQEGDEFFQYYTFYEGPDSVGSNGYINYVSEARATEIGIANVSHETDELDVFFSSQNRRRAEGVKPGNISKEEPFLYLKTAPTEAGPRESIRLEGKRRFNRGLFIIDVRHMPAGCGVWPAFWLTDEANWPVNGEIDIVEGVNYQAEAKTALHTTKGCDMYDVPLGTMTGTWDTAIGIPDKKTGIPDMTMREAKDCFVYDPHQWLNQGCVAIDTDGNSLGIPLNENGGGIFALEWDPVNRHMRTWVFTPHTKVPENLVEAIRTAQEPEEKRVMPDPEEWPIPYGYFPIDNLTHPSLPLRELGDNTNCPSNHFRNMRLVLNTAFCGSVAGNRYFLDCKNESKVYKSCNEYIRSRPEALEEAYWKIRGVYVYQRSWEKAWVQG
eukprot:Nitzschia sp. Nitz4//scaffold17_size182527//81430//83144//NITZ4_001852-RA/size182527-snap-gene-0.295-mRNA-1//-1//CDS//3329539334//9330//frame0